MHNVLMVLTLGVLILLLCVLFYCLWSDHKNRKDLFLRIRKRKKTVRLYD